MRFWCILELVLIIFSVQVTSKPKPFRLQPFFTRSGGGPADIATILAGKGGGFKPPKLDNGQVLTLDDLGDHFPFGSSTSGSQGGGQQGGGQQGGGQQGGDQQGGGQWGGIDLSDLLDIDMAGVESKLDIYLDTIKEQVHRAREGEGRDDGEGPILDKDEVFNPNDDDRRGLVDQPDYLIDEVVDFFHETVTAGCDETLDVICEPEVANMKNRVFSMYQAHKFCEENLEDVNFCTAGSNFDDQFSRVIGGLLEDVPVDVQWQDVYDMHWNSESCYPEDACENLGLKLEDLERELSQFPDCNPKTCAVSKRDFPKFIAQTKDSEGNQAIFGLRTMFVTGLGKMKITRDEVDEIATRLELTSSSARNAFANLCLDGTMPTSQSTLETLQSALHRGIEAECMVNAYEDGYACNAEEIITVFEIQDKNKILGKICDSDNRPRCSDSQNNRALETLRGLDRTMEAESEILRNMPSSCDLDACHDRSFATATNEDIPYCRPAVCDLDRKAIPRFIVSRVKGCKLLFLLGRGLRGDKDFDEVASLCALSSTEKANLVKLIDGRETEVSQTDKDRLVEKINAVKEDECDTCVPAKDEGAYCTESQVRMSGRVKKALKVHMEGCQTKSRGDCSSISEARDHLDALKSFLKGEDVPPPDDFCFHDEICREAKKLVHRADKDDFCRPAFCETKANLLLKLLLKSGGPDGRPTTSTSSGGTMGSDVMEPAGDHMAVGSFFQLLPRKAKRPDADKGFDEVADKVGLTRDEKEACVDELINPNDDATTLSSKVKAAIRKVRTSRMPSHVLLPLQSTASVACNCMHFLLNVALATAILVTCRQAGRSKVMTHPVERRGAVPAL